MTRADDQDPDLGFETRAIHAGQPNDPTTGAVTTPIYQVSTYEQEAVGKHKGYEYSRTGNPTRTALEKCLASLEGARHGFAFASGMAAEDAVLRRLETGQRVVMGNDAYGGTFRLISKVFGAAGINWSAVDLTNPSELADTWPTDAAMVWLETPTNPNLNVIDIEAIAEIAHANGALCVVDNTFATPYLQQPLSLGADIVLHSTTKYVGGHSDVVGGFVGVNDPSIADALAFIQNAVGAVPAPMDCYLLLRGLKTLPVRMDRHCENAEAIVELLQGHPAVSKVLYPGLPEHPGFEVASKQMKNYGGMISFLMADGLDAALELAPRTELFTLAESLGAVESLIEHPGAMTHASTEGSPLEVDASLIRISVGIETTSDLVDDLRQALDSLG